MSPTSTARSTVVSLSESERAHLQTYVHRGHASARTRTRAQVLLKLADDWSEAAVSDAFDVCRNTVKAVVARFRDGGVEAVLTDRRQERRRAVLTGAQQAHLIAIACSPVPDGHDHWTLRMLAGKAIELGFVEGISLETIRALLGRTSSSRGGTRIGASQR